jgi:endonuclease YncB( thermonuclease family)
VKAVHDGDTFYLATGEAIRLAEVDCPEINQPFGEDAHKFTAAYVLHKNISFVRTGHDKYGRTIAKVYTGSTYVNEALVKAGYAWVYQQYASASMYSLELQAKKNNTGLWAQPQPQSPFKFRHTK